MSEVLHKLVDSGDAEAVFPLRKSIATLVAHTGRVLPYACVTSHAVFLCSFQKWKY